MKKELRIGMGPVTGDIYCGHVSAKGIWLANRQIVTLEALDAAARYVLYNGGCIMIEYGDKKPLFKITVEDFRGEDKK